MYSFMHTIGFDISALDPEFKEHAQRGIGRYVRELYKYFKASPATTDPSSGPTIAEFDHRSFSVNWLTNLLPFGRLTVKQQILFPLSLWLRGGSRYQAFHFPAHMDAPSWCPVPYILTVLDLIPLVMADLYKADRPSWRFHLARWLEIRAIKNASLILAISECTARDVQRLLGIEPERIVITPLGVDQKFFEARRHESSSALLGRYNIPADRPIIMYVGGIDQRKNYWTMLQALLEIKTENQKQSKPAPVLLMIGRIEQDRQYPKLQRLITEYGLGGDVCMPGFVPDEDLLQLYQESSLFLFLSLYEGFGLPVLEAMAAGLPVVCSNTSSLPEVAGEAACLVDPTDAHAAALAMQLILDSPARRQELIELGKAQAAKFSWAQTGLATQAAYQQFFKKFKL